MEIYISDETRETLKAAAASAQQWLEHENGEHYRLEDLQQLAVRWLENCIGSLAEDAMHHWFEGNSGFALNRQDFRAGLKRLEVAYTPQEAEQLEAKAVDSLAA